jgi:hypothetical protein
MHNLPTFSTLADLTLVMLTSLSYNVSSSVIDDPLDIVKGAVQDSGYGVLH